jgi:hypothetical protein
MPPEETLEATADEILRSHCGKPLTDIQRMILRESLAGKGYERMEGYATQHIKNEGTVLWSLLSKALGEKVGKKNFKGALDQWQNSREIVKTPPYLTINKSEALTTILMLSANPKSMAPLRLEEEMREVEAGLMRSSLRDNFRLVTQSAVRPSDMQRAILEYSPQVVHFSGHGTGDQGLVLEDENGNVKLVNADALAALFELFADGLQCVVLNACYSDVQAIAITQYIPYVIGMGNRIGDRAAITFAVAFYDALGAGRDVEFSYKHACVAIRMEGISEADIPVFYQKNKLSISLRQPPNKTVQMKKSHNLTEKQMNLLEWLVREVQFDKLDEEEIWVLWTFQGANIVSYEGQVPEIKSTTLDALQNEGCIVGNRKSNNEYRFALTRRAYEVVDCIVTPTGEQPKSSIPSSTPTVSVNPVLPKLPINVFISYSHKDEDLREELDVHLALLKRQGKILAWQDRAIEAGTEWDAEIKRQLEEAQVILLLISPRFIASNYCYDLEMQRAVQRHNEGAARAIPIILKPCDWQNSPFSKLQALPKDAKPITKWDDKDEAFLNVVQGVRQVVEGLQKLG